MKASGDLVTPKDAARMLGCSISQLYKMVADGVVKEYRVDAASFFNRRELAGDGSVTDEAGIVTTLSPDRALAELIQHLAAAGATVTTQTPGTVTGVVAVEEKPDIALAILCFLLGVIPGILYVLLARRTDSHPFALALSEVPSLDGRPAGTRITGSGQGMAVPTLNWAADQLPR